MNVPTNKRDALIDAAASLAHKHGFAATTLAMVAETSGVPLGNVYYYFKSKEALAGAVLERRVAELDETLARCSAAETPEDQLAALLETLRLGADRVAESGCALGRISQDSCDDERRCRELPLSKMQTWTEGRMKALGLTGAKARDAALHFVAALQGASLLSWIHHDSRILRTETKTLETWIRSLR
ncbi:MAG: TetR/AcrR family transcriptional regulator [Acidobacteria bacterium]|nr:TetR/AcrR family transcriptional regulator [Acidobacteriota bacterium]